MMAWKTRNGRRYYYQTVWENGAPRSKYVGGGAAGQYAARQSEASKEAKRQAQHQCFGAKQGQAAVADLANRTQSWSALLLQGSLLVLGYYCNKRVWRERKRYVA